MKNLSAPCCVAYTDVGEGREQDAGSFAYTDVGEGREQDAGSFVALVKGIAINGERRLAGHAEIVRKSMFNCGF